MGIRKRRFVPRDPAEKAPAEVLPRQLFFSEPLQQNLSIGNWTLSRPNGSTATTTPRRLQTVASMPARETAVVVAAWITALAGPNPVSRNAAPQVREGDPRSRWDARKRSGTLRPRSGPCQ